ncbi:MAG: DUF6478 family protein [Albidovulum sp.]
MNQKFNMFLDQLWARRVLARWRRLAGRASTADLPGLRSFLGSVRQLRRELDRVLHVAEGRLANPSAGPVAIRKPLMADWVWRPEAWSGPITPSGQAEVEDRFAFGEEVTVFHDCHHSELSVRQVRNSSAHDLAPFGLRLDVFRFDGSFLSLALDLPAGGSEGIRRSHVIGLNIVVETERPLEIFARLNIKHGPNTEQIVREVSLTEPDVLVEFDLAYTKMNEKRVERAWIDLIFEGPEMNQILLRDLTMSRRPRADL